MASFPRQKEALRGAVFAFLAGIHFVTEEVEENLSTRAVGPANSEAARRDRQAVLRDDYARILASPCAASSLADILDEEDLYPYGSEWPREAIGLLLAKIRSPELSFCDAKDAGGLRFRFRKGFKALLNELAAGIDGTKRHASTLDHWLVLLFNAAFHAGVTAAAREAANPKAYFEALQEVEDETEPWSRYPQIAEMLDRQLRRETRRRTGLVSDLEF